MTSDKHHHNPPRSREAQLEQLIDETPFMLTRCSRDLRYLFVSRAYAAMLGRAAADIEGKPIIDVMGEDGFAVVRPYVERVLRGERVEYENEVSFAGVGPRLLRVVYTPDRSGDGQVVGWMASGMPHVDGFQFLEQVRRHDNPAVHRLPHPPGQADRSRRARHDGRRAGEAIRRLTVPTQAVKPAGVPTVSAPRHKLSRRQAFTGPNGGTRHAPDLRDELDP